MCDSRPGRADEGVWEQRSMQGRQPGELWNGALLDEAGREQRAAHTRQATAAERDSSV